MLKFCSTLKIVKCVPTLVQKFLVNNPKYQPCFAHAVTRDKLQTSVNNIFTHTVTASHTDIYMYVYNVYSPNDIVVD